MLPFPFYITGFAGCVFNLQFAGYVFGSFYILYISPCCTVNKVSECVALLAIYSCSFAKCNHYVYILNLFHVYCKKKKITSF